MSNDTVVNLKSAVKSRNGRPTDFTPELAEEICIAIACSSKGVKRLCEEHKHWPSFFTIFNWIRTSEEFSQQYARAKMAQITVIVDEMLDIIVEADDINKVRLEIDARKWLACKLVPKVYGNNPGVTVDHMTHAQWLDYLE